MSMTAIRWASHSWNPFIGCSIVSPGCSACYAMHQAERILRMQRGRMGASHYEGAVTVVKGKPVWTGAINQASEKTRFEPLSWARPRSIFVGSMSDFFHPSADDAWRVEALAVMALTPQHTYLILTKRSADTRRFLADPATQAAVWTRSLELPRARDFLARRMEQIAPGHWPLKNVALGVSVEDQKRAHERLPDLEAAPAALKFASCEPLLGELHIRRYLPFLDLVIAGGENDLGDRMTHPEWMRGLYSQCRAAGKKFHLKQWGKWAAAEQLPGDQVSEFFQMEARVAPAPNDPNCRTRLLDRAGRVYRYDQQLEAAEARAIMMLRVGTAHSGRLLDGREHDDVFGDVLGEVA